MNDKLQDQLDRLTIILKERRRHYRESMRNMFYFCIIILVFFSLYSALISYKIHEIATPSTVALLIAGELREQYADSLKEGKADFHRTASDMSQSALLAVPVGIHAAGELIRESMASDAQSAALDIAEALKLPLHRNIDQFFASGEEKFLPSIPSGVDLKELCGIGKNLMFPVPLAVGEHLRKIRLKKNAALTRQDLCDRDLMLCWLFLSDHERYRDTRFARTWMDFSSTVIRSWEDVMNHPVQNNTKNRPIQKKTPAIP